MKREMAEKRKKESAADDGSGQGKRAVWIGVAAVVVAAVAVYLALLPSNETGQATTAPKPMTEAERTIMQTRGMIADGKTDLALKFVKRYIEQHPDDVVVRPTLADIYRRLGQQEKFEQQIDKILQIAPDNPNALWLKGLLNYQRGSEFMSFFRRAAEQPNAGPKIWGGFGVLMADYGDLDSARQYLSKAVRAGTQDGGIFLVLGQIAFVENRFSEALDWLRKAAQVLPNDMRVWVLMGEVQRNMGNPRTSVKSLQRALKVASEADRGAVLVQLGQSYVVMKQWVKAAEAFVRASEHAPARGARLLQAGKCYYFAEEYDLAMKYIDLASAAGLGKKTVEEWRRKIENSRSGKSLLYQGASSQPRSLLDVPRKPPGNGVEDNVPTKPAFP